MESKYTDLSNVEYSELLQIQKKANEFLKYVNSEYETIKRVEEENS